MSRETPATPKMSPRALRTGTLVVRSQDLAARGVVDVFLDVDHRPAIADDLLFVVEELLRDLQRQQLDVAFADHVSGFGMAHARRRDLVADDETTLDVLDPEVVVEAIDQGLQRNALVEPGALVAQFGDVFVSRNPTAAGKRLPPDRDRPAVGQFVAPFARLFVETHRRAKHQIVADFKRQGSSREAQIDDRTPRGARLQTFRIEPIKIGIAAVAERQARLAVENADPLRQRFDRGVQAAGFLVEAVDLRFLPARGGLLSVVGGAQQAREGGIADRSLVGAGLSFRAHSKTLQITRQPLRRRVPSPPKPWNNREALLMEDEKRLAAAAVRGLVTLA